MTRKVLTVLRRVELFGLLETALDRQRWRADPVVLPLCTRREYSETGIPSRTSRLKAPAEGIFVFEPGGGLAPREQRIAHNETISRDINEAIEQSHNEASREGYVRMVCECGQDQCERLISISVEEYETMRRDPRSFALVKDHVIPDVEYIVKDLERYVVVRKRSGESSEVATAHYPRS